jgi:hypothetical protein
METDMLETGCDLTRMKERLGHGKFLKWIDAEFAITPRTAQKYMNAADVFSGKYELVSHLPPSIIYDLAAPSTPPHVRDEILQRLETGERPPASIIREMVRTAKGQRRQQQKGERKEQQAALGATDGEANSTQAAADIIVRELGDKLEALLQALGENASVNRADLVAAEARASEAERLSELREIPEPTVTQEQQQGPVYKREAKRAIGFPNETRRREAEKAAAAAKQHQRAKERVKGEAKQTPVEA